MYIPHHFEETRAEELHRVIAEYPLGTLVVNGPNGLDANHLPFELHATASTSGKLLAHVARANDIWREIRSGEEALVIFRGEDAYVSPNWYPSKLEVHRQVPTWNYRVVHVHGKDRDPGRREIRAGSSHGSHAYTRLAPARRSPGR